MMTDDAVSCVLLHTQDMMMAVIEGQWEALASMQRVQAEMLKALFSVSDAVFLEQEQNDFFEVQRLNQEILKEAERHKIGIATELRGLRQGKVKAGAYQL